MHTNRRFVTSFIIAFIVGHFVQASAGELDIPITFQSGTPARAADVNQNFDAVEVAVDDNAQTIAALQTQIAALEATVAALQASLDQVSNNSVLALGGVLTLDQSDPVRPVAVFSGVNLQITDGRGVTGVGWSDVNGLGNLIIGYDEARADTATPECSEGRYANFLDCTTNGAVWAASHKNGSHNLIIDPSHNYSQFGSMVTGAGNTISEPYSAALGASAGVAGNHGAIVVGGALNQAREEFSVVVGGQQNLATGQKSIVTGGEMNIASAKFSSVNGGGDNLAWGGNSVVSGGYFNTAVGYQSAVSGGASRTAPNDFNWTAGSLTEPN